MHPREIGSFEAKTHFSQILMEVAQGNEVIITKHGKRVAVLSPFQKVVEEDSFQSAIETIRHLRKNVKLNGIGEKLSIQMMKEEGRR